MVSIITVPLPSIAAQQSCTPSQVASQLAARPNQHDIFIIHYDESQEDSETFTKYEIWIQKLVTKLEEEGLSVHQVDDFERTTETRVQLINAMENCVCVIVPLCGLTATNHNDDYERIQGKAMYIKLPSEIEPDVKAVRKSFHSASKYSFYDCSSDVKMGKDVKKLKKEIENKSKAKISATMISSLLLSQPVGARSSMEHVYQCLDSTTPRGQVCGSLQPVHHALPDNNASPMVGSGSTRLHFDNPSAISHHRPMTRSSIAGILMTNYMYRLLLYIIIII